MSRASVSKHAIGCVGCSSLLTSQPLSKFRWQQWIGNSVDWASSQHNSGHALVSRICWCERLPTRYCRNLTTCSFSSTDVTVGPELAELAAWLATNPTLALIQWVLASKEISSLSRCDERLFELIPQTFPRRLQRCCTLLCQLSADQHHTTYPHVRS